MDFIKLLKVLISSKLLTLPYKCLHRFGGGEERNHVAVNSRVWTVVSHLPTTQPSRPPLECELPGIRVNLVQSSFMKCCDFVFEPCLLLTIHAERKVTRNKVTRKKVTRKKAQGQIVCTIPLKSSISVSRIPAISSV